MNRNAGLSVRDEGTFADAVERQVEKIIASKCFRSSPRRQLLLRRIVTESLAGRTEGLKEIVLARDVFGRPEYDPRHNTLVRVEVNAIRHKIAEYYAGPNRDDLIRIEIPPGHYVAVFSPLHKAAGRRIWREAWFIAIACVVVIFSVLAILVLELRSHPAPAVVPVQITFDTGWTSQPAVSWDGSVMIYASDRGPTGNTEIWIQESGKAPHQLTHDAAHDITPDISPDGKQVVFRSWRKEEGIWSISSRGENLKLLAKGGYNPRFSPDGKWVAFSGMATDDTGHLFIVASTGGMPERLDYDTEETEFPVWSPDGTELMFTGKGNKGANYDLWRVKVHPTHREPARPVGVRAQLRAQNLPQALPWGQEWTGNRILFVAHENDTAFLFQAAVKSSGIGDIKPVPYAIGAVWARMVRTPRQPLSLLFATERRQTNIWGYYLGSPGQSKQLTRDNSLQPGWDGTWPALSSDGNYLAFITGRSGSPDICVKDLRTGMEQLLAAVPTSTSPVFLDRDGQRVVFERKQGPVVSVVIRDLRENRDRVITTDCPVLHDWSSDGKLLLCSEGTDLFEIRVDQWRRLPLLHLPRNPERARFSPDVGWVSYVNTTSEGQAIVGYLAPLDGSNRTVKIDQEVYTLSLHWSADGNSIYYWSVRDGFRCLYMQRLDARTKVPIGAPVAVLHRHASQHYPWSGGTLATGSGLVAMTLTDELANIWKVDLPR